MQTKISEQMMYLLSSLISYRIMSILLCDGRAWKVDGRAWKVDGRALALVGPGLATPL